MLGCAETEAKEVGGRVENDMTQKNIHAGCGSKKKHKNVSQCLICM